ncbi:MAG: ABC transporter substrate-binding protein [Clostridiales bacterium]|nr:ABC transporter substrate-binding protein [Clostridiales bacterium]
MKKFFVIVLAIAMVFSMVSLASAEAKDTLVVAAPDESATLSTTAHDALQTAYLNVLSYNGLMKLDYTMNPVPDLAESYEISEDGCTWTFKLREGVKFHDGTELTAEDVVASMIAAKSEANVANYTKDYTNVEATDKYVVTITTDGYNSNLLYSLANHANFVLPKAQLDAGHNFNEEPIGTGAYKFIRWNHGDSIEFEANEDYFAGAPAFKKLIWRFIPEGTSRSLALEGGEVDFVIDVDAANMAGIQDNGDLKMIIVDSISLQFLNLNDEKGYLSDLNVRKAINCAINKQAVVQIAENGHAMVAYAQAPIGFSGATDAGCDTEYNVEKAKEYLAAWGGNPADIEISIICSNDAKKRAAEVILSNLKDVGINATIEQMDLATYLDVTAAGNHTAFIGGYTASSMVQYLMNNFHSTAIGAANKSRLNMPEVDALIEKAAAARTNEEAAEILTQVNTLINEQCPQVSLYQNQKLYASKAGVDNVNVLPNGYFYVAEWTWAE